VIVVRAFWIAIALAIACPKEAGASDSLTVAHPIVNVCSLLSTSEASAILGGPAAAFTDDPASICRWEARDESGGEHAVWLAVEWPGPSESDRLRTLADFGTPALSAQPISGLLAQAVWLRLKTSSYTPSALVVLRSGLKMTVYATGVEQAVETARQALAAIQAQQ
jgi:hypothetical protein